jgi:cytochrome P450
MNMIPLAKERLNPFQFYSTMRHNNPVVYDEKIDAWGVFRYYDVQSILGDYTSFSADPENSKSFHNEVIPAVGKSLLKSDPPYHRTLRGVIASAFTPMAIDKLEPRIESIIHRLINQVIEKGNMDLINDLAYTLPVTVIAELLGVPMEDHIVFHKWFGRYFSQVVWLSEGVGINEDEHALTKHLFQLRNEIDSYFNAIIDKRIKSPQQDLVSGLIKAKADGHALSREEVLSFCTLLFIAGHITTANLMGNTILSLLQNPQQLKILQSNRASLISPTIEETLRYRSPIQATIRNVIRDVNIGEQKIQSGSKVYAWLGSANHDESIFPEPEIFNISRTPHGHAHVGFGHGIHFCLGAPLARLESRVVLKILLSRLQNLELDLDNIENMKPIPSLILHGVSHLPLRFKPGPQINLKEEQTAIEKFLPNNSDLTP